MAYIETVSPGGGGGGGNYNCGTSILKGVAWNAKLGDFSTTKKAAGFVLSTLNGGLGRAWTITCFGTNAHLALDANGTMNNKDMILDDVTYSENAVTIDYLASEIDSTLAQAGGSWRWSFTPIYDS